MFDFFLGLVAGALLTAVAVVVTRARRQPAEGTVMMAPAILDIALCKTFTINAATGYSAGAATVFGARCFVT